MLPGFKIPKAPDLGKNIFQKWESTSSDHIFGKARLEFDLAPNWTIYAAGGGSSIRERFFTQNPTIDDPSGALDLYTLNSGGRETQWTSEGGIRGTFDTGFIHHAVAVSANSYWIEYPFSGGVGYPTVSNLYDPVSIPAPAPGLIARTTYNPSPGNRYGVAGVDTMTLLDGKLDLIGGVRQQWDTSTTFSATTGARLSSYDESALSPLGAVVVRPLDWLSVYASYAEGFSSGPTAPATAANANQVFPPTVSTQVETGVKAAFGSIGASLAFYQITLPSAFQDPVTRVFGVNGEQVNRGIDLNVFGEPLPGVRVLGGVSLLDGTLTKTQGGTFNGKTAPGVPGVQVSFGSECDLPPWMLPGLTLTGRVVYTGEQFYDQANTQSIPDWTRLDLGARYTFAGYGDKPVVARFNVDNVTGLNYWGSTGGGSLSLGTPRTYKLSLQMDF